MNIPLFTAGDSPERTLHLSVQLLLVFICDKVETKYNASLFTFFTSILLFAFLFLLSSILYLLIHSCICLFIVALFLLVSLLICWLGLAILLVMSSVIYIQSFYHTLPKKTTFALLRPSPHRRPPTARERRFCRFYDPQHGTARQTTSLETTLGEGTQNMHASCGASTTPLAVRAREWARAGGDQHSHSVHPAWCTLFTVATPSTAFSGRHDC